MSAFDGLPILSSDFRDVHASPSQDKLLVQGLFRSSTLVRHLDPILAQRLEAASTTSVAFDTSHVLIGEGGLLAHCRFRIKGLAGAVHRGWISVQLGVGIVDGHTRVDYQTYDCTLEGFNVGVDVLVEGLIADNMPVLGRKFADDAEKRIDALLATLGGTLPVRITTLVVEPGSSPFRLLVG